MELPDDSGYRDVVEKFKSGVPLFPVGASSESFELAEKLDYDAKRLHLRYLIQREKQNRRKKLSNGKYESKADYDWEYLDEIRKSWNRASADHIEVKLRAIADFYNVAENRPTFNLVTEKNDYEVITPQIIDIVKSGVSNMRNDLELLARLEHDRWSAEKFVEGWVFADKKDEVRKLSPYLTSYENLTEEIKGYDREAVVEMLKAIVNDQNKFK
ncbi:MAG: hypothetical protein HQK62_15385 [Desulfamplus sp.]|nr:hypothetical protein [Desulfamplus sp.]